MRGHSAELRQTQFECRFPAGIGLVAGYRGRLILRVFGFVAQMPFQHLARPYLATPDELGRLQHLQLLRQQGMHRVERLRGGRFRGVEQGQRIGRCACGLGRRQLVLRLLHQAVQTVLADRPVGQVRLVKQSAAHQRSA